MNLRPTLRAAGVVAVVAIMLLVAHEAWSRLAERRAALRAVDTHRRAAALALEAEEFALAESALRAAIQLRPADPDLRQELLRLSARWVAAVPERLDDAALRPALRAGLRRLGVYGGRSSEPRLSVAAGYLALRDEDPEAAQAFFVAALRRDPGCVEAHLAMGAMYRASGKPDVARKAYEEAFAHGPNNVRAINSLGVLHLDEGRVDEAIALFERAITVRDNAVSRTNLAGALASRDRLTEALGHYERAVQLGPELEVAARRYGAALLKAGKRAEAVQVLTKTLSREPDTDAMLTLAYAQQGLGNHRAAASLLRQVLARDGERYAAAFALGVSLEALDEPAGAREAYARFVRHAPESDPRREPVSAFLAHEPARPR